MELKGGPGSRRFDYKQKLLLKATRKSIFLRPQMYKGKRSLKEKKKQEQLFHREMKLWFPLRKPGP